MGDNNFDTRDSNIYATLFHDNDAATNRSPLQEEALTVALKERGNRQQKSENSSGVIELASPYILARCQEPSNKDKDTSAEARPDKAFDTRTDAPQSTEQSIARLIFNGVSTPQQQRYIDDCFSAAFERGGTLGKQRLLESVNAQLKMLGAEVKMKRQYTEQPEERPVETIADAVSDGIISNKEVFRVLEALESVFRHGGHQAIEDTVREVNSKIKDLTPQLKLLSVEPGSNERSAVAIHLYNSKTAQGTAIVDTYFEQPSRAIK